MARLLNRLLTFKLLAREDHDLSFYSSYSLIAYGFLVFLVSLETKPLIVGDQSLRIIVALFEAKTLLRRQSKFIP